MIRVVTDSLANLPQVEADRLGIAVIPAYVTFGDETLRDGLDLTQAEFYHRLEQSSDLPTTSQPSVNDFSMLYQTLLSDSPGCTILSLHVSSALSGTVESARQAARQMPEADIRVIDTLSLTLGQGLIVREAAQMVQSGRNEFEILERIGKMRDTMHIYFTTNTLKYLAEGGRIGRAARLMGTLLDQKPILNINKGAVESHSRATSREGAIAALRDLALTHGRGRQNLQVGVMHAVCEADARYLAEQLRATLSPDVILLSEIGPAIGVHTGPGALGVCWCTP